MELTHDTEQKRFVAKLQSADAAEAVIHYTVEGLVWNMYHVFVPKAFRGQGVAEKLASYAFQEARKAGKRVKPTCPYLSGVFLPRHPEWRDLVG